MTDPVDNLKYLRDIPEQIAALGQQMLLNLVLGSIDEEGKVDMVILMKLNGKVVDYAKIVRENAEKINMNFDSLMVKLGYPEGTGKFVC